MTIGCNIWMICLKLNRFFYGLSRMLHISEFIWTLRSSVFVVFNNFLLIDATDRSKIISDQMRLFIALSLYPLLFFANTPFKPLDRFQDNVRFSIFEHILNLKYCRVFETKPTFPFLSIILNSEQNSLAYNLQNKSLKTKIILT